MDSSNPVACKAAVKEEPFALAHIAIPEVAFAIKEDDVKQEVKPDPGIAGCPLAHDPEAQLAALAPVIEEDDEEEEPTPPRTL